MKLKKKESRSFYCCSLGSFFKNPSEILSGYYAEIAPRVRKPIAFAEVGWHSTASPAGWESSSEKQKQIIKKFFELTKGASKEFVIWSFLYDQNTAEPFNSMNLIDSNSVAKPAWNAWLTQEN